MQAKPLFLGACAVASIAGAIGGAALDTSPIQRAGIGSAMLPEPSVDFYPSDGGQELAPDHYAMTTPEGRIEVAELANRGLFSQRRFGWDEASYMPPAPPPFDPPEAEAEVSQAETTPADADLSTELPPEPAPVTPRVIDVTAELASG